MKKMLVGMLCSTILFVGLAGSIQADASEIGFESDDRTEYVKQATDVKQPRAGYINGIYYRISQVFSSPPYKYKGLTRVYVTRNSSGGYIGYYR